MYTLVFYVGKNLIAGEMLDAKYIIWRLMTGYSHLWFIPMIIGLYLTTPVLKLWVIKGNKRAIEYFLVLALIFNFAVP